MDRTLNMRDLRMPIYGCVIKTLSFTYVDESQIVKSDSYTLKGEGLTIDEYVDEYLFMCENLYSIY